MVKQADLQAAYEYGVKLAYEDLQKNAADLYGRAPEAWEAAGTPEVRLPPDAHPYVPAPAEKAIGQMTAEEIMAHLKARGGGMMDQIGNTARGAVENVKGLAGQTGEMLAKGYGASNQVADRFLSHMGRHPAAYGLGAAGIGAAGLTGLGLGIGNAVRD